MSECGLEVDAQEGGILLCTLSEDHTGLHYDEVVGLSFKEGKPDE